MEVLKSEEDLSSVELGSRFLELSFLLQVEEELTSSDELHREE